MLRTTAQEPLCCDSFNTVYCQQQTLLQPPLFSHALPFVRSWWGICAGHLHHPLPQALLLSGCQHVVQGPEHRQGKKVVPLPLL